MKNCYLCCITTLVEDIKWLKERVKNQASLYTCNAVLPLQVSTTSKVQMHRRRRRRSKRRAKSKPEILQQYRMAIPEVNKNLLAELEAMGFSMPRALNAFHFPGNTSLEAAIDWILDHENDATIDQMPLVLMDIPIETPNSFEASDQESEQAHMDTDEEHKLVEKEEGKDITKSDTQLNLELAESARKMEQMGECLRSLRRQNMENDTQVKTVFHTLLTYVTNVVSFPENGRFRRIRLSNPAFQKRVGKFKQGVEFLELCGFVKVEGGDFLLLSRDKVDIQMLKAASALLHSAITNPFFGLLSKADM